MGHRTHIINQSFTNLPSIPQRSSTAVLAIPVDMQLAAADYGRQFVVSMQGKPYLVILPVLLEEFPLQVRTHIAGINLHHIPPSL